MSGCKNILIDSFITAPEFEDLSVFFVLNSVLMPFDEKKVLKYGACLTYV